MIVRRAISKSFTCIDCRLRLLSALVSVSGLSSPRIATRSFAKPIAAYRPLTLQLRELGSLRSDETASVAAQHGEFTENSGSQKSQDSVGSDEAQDLKEPTPWYLQVEPPDQETTNSLLQQQRLPELPPNPPPLLQPMLEHIFVELGIDDLMLFDLRKLDPPPALGANLIMIIGTARSEKHLHVSADRFCRYMKTTHQIAPYADGLLGRGELKLKLKRKARRARILSRVGSTEPVNTDDGIRTGWICVTVNNIEDGRPVEDAPRLPDEYVGFGEAEQGANIVIQLLTQEKREELDLEDLWGKTLRRHERKQDRILRGVTDPDLEDEVGLHEHNNGAQSADFLPQSSSSSSIRPIVIPKAINHPHSGALHRVRGFSTLDRKYHDPAPDPPPLNSGSDEIVESTVANKFLAALPAQYEEQLRLNGEATAATFRLNAHLDFALGLSLEDARSILGSGAQDASSTSFLRSFHNALPLFPTAEQWHTRLSLITLGMAVSAPNYTKEDLAHRFQEMQSALLTIPGPIYKETITTLLQPTLAESHPDQEQHPQLSPSSIHHAASILDDMLFRGHPFSPSSDETDSEIRALFELAPLLVNAPSSLHPNALSRLRNLFDTPAPLSLEIAKLQACVPKRNFPAMWAIWHSFAAAMRPRPPGLYVAMLEAFAATGHQARNMEVLRVLVPEMEREEGGGVRLEGEVVEGVRACLRVVEPRGEGGGEGEWGRLWGVCEKVREEEGRWAREMDDD